MDIPARDIKKAANK